MNDISSVSYLQTLHAGPYSKFDFLLVFLLCLPHLGQAEPKQCQKCAKLYRDPSAICQVDICNAVNKLFTGLSQGPVIWKCFSVLSYLKLFFIYEGPLFIRNEAITSLEQFFELNKLPTSAGQDYLIHLRKKQHKINRSCSCNTIKSKWTNVCL